MGDTHVDRCRSNAGLTDYTGRINTSRGQQLGTERARRIRGGDRETATSVSKAETEVLFRDIGRKTRAKSILRGASSNRVYVEHASGTGRL